MGLEGYRTPADIALREHLANPPSGYTPTTWKDHASGFEKKLANHPMNKGDPAGSGKGGKESEKYGLSVGLSGVGGIADLGFRFGRKRAAKAKDRSDAENATNAARLAKETAEWEAKKAELEKQRDFELQTYSPTAELEKTPGYKYRYNTGLTTANNSLSKINMRQSGREQKELTQYGQEFGSGEFQNEVNRLTGLVTGGQNAQTTLGNISVGQGSALSNIYGQQARDNSQYYGNLNEGLQGSLSNFSTAKNRNNNKYGSSYDTNSPSDNSGYQPGQTLDNWNNN